ncbi:hypothetical protein HID58_065214 [Brassica napus]|uniref:PPM-type phosphatase domain-containing protein n=1 Tax=Brassica napus TaxID=3708 RepID=A0ABQ7ZC52_BRANA|nr:hypothetical protein HID58_065214 [Brassica napus]
MEKQPNQKQAADSFSSEDMISPPAKKAKKSEETGCDNTKDLRISSGAGEEMQEIPSGGEEVIAAVDNRAAEEGSSSCISEEKKGFVFEADVAEDKGARQAMEDVSVLLPDASLDFPGKLRCGHFAIYDGHGGRLAAEFAKKHLHLNVLSSGLPRELVSHQLLSRLFLDPNLRLLLQMDLKVAKKAILDGFRKTDELLLQESVSGGWQDGATAVCVWIVDQKVFIANIGDAKAVLARSSTTNESGSHTEACNPLKAIVLTREHKAIYPQERSRIQKSGGVVSSNGRIQGRLEVSRAFGDRQFKKFGVIATPDIHAFELTERENFMILGCDGLWEVFGPSDAVGYVQKLLKEGLPVSTISRRLVKEAVKERRCKDNCTAIVIVFRRG